MIGCHVRGYKVLPTNHDWSDSCAWKAPTDIVCSFGLYTLHRSCADPRGRRISLGGDSCQCQVVLTVWTAQIWSVGYPENHWSCCHQMSHFMAKMHQIRFWPWLHFWLHWGAYIAPPDCLTKFKGREGKEEKGRKGRVRKRAKWGDGRWREGREREKIGGKIASSSPNESNCNTTLSIWI